MVTSLRNAFRASPVTGLVWAALLAVGLLVALTWFLQEVQETGGAPAEITLAPVLLVTVLVLVLSLGGLSIAVGRLRLGDAREALGLPAGSVRAILALLLVVLFFILSIYMFGQLKNPGGQVSALKGVTAAELATVPLDQQLSREMVTGPDGTLLYNVTLRNPMSRTAENFALQLLTTMSTLVVAVSAFYFGSNAVASALKVTRAEAPDEVPPVLVTPGEWKSALGEVPGSLADLQAGGFTGDPATAWAQDQFLVLGDGTHARWDGKAWGTVN